jgi:hypothetical protein
MFDVIDLVRAELDKELRHIIGEVADIRARFQRLKREDAS